MGEWLRAFSRGAEVTFHGMAMVRSSALKLIVVSALLAVLAAAALTYRHLGPTQAEIVLDQARARLGHRFDPGAARSGPAKDALRLGDGRTDSYALRYLTFHVLLLFPTGVAVMGGRLLGAGLELLAARPRRGTVLVDRTDRAKPSVSFRAAEAVRGLRILVLAAGLGAGMVWSLSGPVRVFLPAYLWLTLAEVPGLGALLDGAPVAPGHIYLSEPLVPGWYQPEGLRADLYAHWGSPGPWVRTWLATTSALSVIGLLLLRMRRGGEQAPKAPLRMAQLDIPEALVNVPMMVCGSTGSGKTVAIMELLDQVRARGQRALVYDPSGEYLEPYFREGYDHLLAPMDPRGDAWALASEVETPGHYDELARSLFPRPAGTGGSDRFFQDAAARLFAATARALPDAPTSELVRWLGGATETETLHAHLLETGESAAAHLLSEPKTAANILATVAASTTALGFLRDVPADQPGFSIRRYLRDDVSDRWLFLASRADVEQTLRPLISLWCDLVAKTVLTLPRDGSRVHWLVLDEVASLQRLPSLPVALQRGRKHGLRPVLGLQGTQQLEAHYGSATAADLLLQLQNVIALRCADPNSAQYLARRLGEVEVEEARESYSLGAHAMRDGVSVQHQEQRRPLISATEFQTLPDLQGYATLRGRAEVYRLRFRVKTRLSGAARPDSRPEKLSTRSRVVRAVTALSTTMGSRGSLRAWTTGWRR